MVQTRLGRYWSQERRSAVARKRSKPQGVGGKPTNVKTFAKRKKAMDGGIINMTRMVQV